MYEQFFCDLAVTESKSCRDNSARSQAIALMKGSIGLSAKSINEYVEFGLVFLDHLSDQADSVAEELNTSSRIADASFRDDILHELSVLVHQSSLVCREKFASLLRANYEECVL